jgi:hypothetical protein
MSAPLVNATTATVRSTVQLPQFPVCDPECYASIHSNPPGTKTTYAGLTVNSYGKGKCVYLYSSLLKHQQYSQETFGRELFGEFVTLFIENAADLPACVEITFMRSSTSPETYLLGAVNCQTELPNVPVMEMRLEINLPNGFIPEKITKASNGKTIDFTFADGVAEVTLQRLENIELLEIKGKGE